MCANTGFTVLRASAVLLRFALGRRLCSLACQSRSSPLKKPGPLQPQGLQEPQVFCPPPSTVRRLPVSWAYLCSLPPQAPYLPPASRFFQGCHSLQAFPGAPRKSSQAFSGAPGSVVRVHRRFQGLPQLDAPRSFPQRSQGSTQGFQIFQVFHGFFQVVKVYRPPRGPGVPRFFPVLPGLS